MFGQNFYTPRRISVPYVLESERPYAAWLYVGISAEAAQTKRLRRVELQLGTTGKPAFGREVQTWWHARPFINAPRPMGWDHQVKTVPGDVGVIATWDDKFAAERKTSGLRPFVVADVTPYYRISVGNVQDFAGAGATARAGYNLQRRWAEKIGPTVRIASLQPTAIPAPKVRRWELEVFAGSEVRAVAWNALLQRETYTPRRLPTIARGVADFEVGVGSGWRRVCGGFRLVWRSPEFDGARWNRFAGLFITTGPSIK